MATTTNFNLPYPEGSEIYNPLITEPVAMPIIDGQMRENQLAAIQEASHVKQGTNHAITLAVADSTRFVFIASDDYTTGDTFTVDGQDVTVRVPNGEAPKTGCFKINSAVVCILDSGILTLETYNKTVIDEALNPSSTNPVTNAAVTTSINSINTLINSIAGDVDTLEDAVALKTVSLTANSEIVTENYSYAKKIGKLVVLNMDIVFTVPASYTNYTLLTLSEAVDYITRNGIMTNTGKYIDIFNDTEGNIKINSGENVGAVRIRHTLIMVNN